MSHWSGDRLSLSVAGEFGRSPCGGPLAASWLAASSFSFVAYRLVPEAFSTRWSFSRLSRNESLSLAVLEAQSAGIPVIVQADNPVLTAHLSHDGGRAVGSFEEFAAALDDLWQNPEQWRTSSG